MRRLSFLVVLLSLVTMMTAGCRPAPVAQAVRFVNLDNLQPLPTPVEREIRPLRVAIAAVFSASGTAESYTPLLNYISDKLGRPVERVQRRTYAEVNELVRNGEVELAIVCTSSYLIGMDEFDMRLLVAPQVAGEVSYQAKLIVPMDSPAKGIADLRGKVFAFTDPLSFSGRIYPAYLLQEMGEAPESFFERTFFTYSHDNAIQAVANGLADGASVDSLVLTFALQRNPELSKQIKIIHSSPPFGMPPVVLSPQVRPQLQVQLAEIFLGMDKDPAGQQALASLGYDRFVQVEEADYLTAKEVQQSVVCCSPEKP